MAREHTFNALERPDWGVAIYEPDGGGFSSIKRIEAEDHSVSWEAVYRPSGRAYNDAFTEAREYLAHVALVQDPELRDQVFLLHLPTRDVQQVY